MQTNITIQATTFQKRSELHVQGTPMNPRARRSPFPPPHTHHPRACVAADRPLDCLAVLAPFAFDCSFGREAILISRCAASSMGGEVFPKGKLFVQEGEGRGLRRRVRALADDYAWSGAAELAPRPSATRLRRRFSRHFPKTKGLATQKKYTLCGAFHLGSAFRSARVHPC